MSPLQLAEVMRTRETPTELQIYAPEAGFILARNISKGQRFDKSTEWFRIADLSRVWVLADVFERDAKYIRPGQTARVKLAGGASATARVSEVLPQFDRQFADPEGPASRWKTPGYALRPEMFVDVELPVALPAVDRRSDGCCSRLRPEEDSLRGHGERVFEPREVETGWRFDDRIEIVKA